MNEQDYSTLGKHLELVYPMIDEFCRVHGYCRVDARSIGRYPRIRIEKPGEINRWFDLWMGLDKDGKRFEKYFDDVPYDLSAGAHADFKDKTPHGHRYQQTYQCFAGKPFREVPAILHAELEKNLKIIEGWTLETLMKEGKKVQLG